MRGACYLRGVMPRLPQSPDIEWKPDGTPVASRHGDVYFTACDGLEEARAVFLRGNGLPDRWAGRDRFTVAETGFGTGLNLLALWELWRRSRPSPGAVLHMVSFEAYPMRREDAARALGAWPELAPLARQLLAHWPHPARGVRQLGWPDEGVWLTLHVGDIAEMLPDARFRADAWFLDGFSPARNGEMWADDLYPLMAARSAPGATAATFTVAGAVRRGLAAAGFEVAKRPGHGRKRERLEARLEGPPPAIPPAPALPAPEGGPVETVAVLGAGIMGACLARRLRERGLEVTVFDPASAPASGASGNPLGLVMPRLDAADTVQARLLVDAYLAARMAYGGLPGVTETEVRQSPRDETERKRHGRVLADPPLPLEDLEALADGGLLHKRALIVEPRRLVGTLLEGVETRFGAPARLAQETLAVDGRRFDAVILASGMAVAAEAPWLGLRGRLGQVEHVTGCPDAPPSALAAGHYALATGGERLWGASFEAWDGAGAPVRAAAQAANREALETLAPWWLVQVRGATPVSRAGVRATTPDRLPVAGPLPDGAAVMARFAPLAKGQPVSADVPLVPGLWVATGLGSRGFTFAPWLASLVTAQLMGDPLPAGAAAIGAVSPMRILLRALRRGEDPFGGQIGRPAVAS